MKRERRWCFIIGSKGIPAHYGGFETFVEKLTQYSTNEQISYYVARMGTRDFWYGYNGAKCFSLAVPDIGPAKAVYYDLKALQKCIDYCKTHPYIKKPIFYVLACRIGPFIHFFKKQIRRLDGMLYVNPDGHEWMRQKWCLLIRKYWKFSERLMVRSADILICDSKNIEAYIRAAYVKYMPCTFYISYGADLSPSVLADDDPKFLGWCQEKGLKAKGYYLVVGRFVPENSFETIIREFMVSGSKYDLAIHYNGRPSMDLVMLIKIPFIQYLYGIRSMRQTIREIQVNVAYRWFLVLDMMDSVPHFFTFGKNYTCRPKDIDFSEQIFAHILGRCMDTGLADISHIFANTIHIRTYTNSKKMQEQTVHDEALWYEDELKKEIAQDRECHGKKH